MKFYARLFLQITDDAEEIARLRIAARTEHADQALSRRVSRLAELLEANRRLDVVAQDRLAGLDIARQHGVDAFAQEIFREGGIARHAALHQFLETPRHGHLSLRHRPSGRRRL